MATNRPVVRNKSAETLRYFDDPGIEAEIFHDTRWPNLRIRPSGEIISVSQAARVLYLLTFQYSFESIVQKFQEEWDRGLDRDDIDAITRREFDVTDEPLPGGIHVIRQQPVIAEPGYVKGQVIPAGIRYEIINLRRFGIGFLRTHVGARWGLKLERHTIANLIQEWQTETLVRIHTIPHYILPDDSRPMHDGMTLAEFTTASRNRPEAADRIYFSNPPPVYTPRPTFRGESFPHPRELRDVEGHHLPFFQPRQRPNPPSYSPGREPPSYELVSGSSGGSTSARASLLNSRVPSSQKTSRHPTIEPEFQQASLVSNSRALTPFEGKAEHWPRRPSTFKRYSRSNVISILFDGMDVYSIFPEGQFEPVQLEAETSKNTRSYITMGRRQREALKAGKSLQSKELFEEFVNPVSNHLSQEGLRLSTLVPAVLYELQMSSCETSRRAMAEFTIVPTVDGSWFLLNHMRLNRHAGEIVHCETSTLVEAVMDELRLSSNRFVVSALEKHAANLPTSPRQLQNLLTEIKKRRDANPPIPLRLFPCNVDATRLAEESWPFATTSFRVRLERGASPFSGHRAIEYRERLKGTRDLLFAMLESTTDGEFVMSRLALEYLVDRVRKLTSGRSAARTEMEAILARIRQLKNVSRGRNLPTEWWASILTNISLIMMGQSDDCVLWLKVPELKAEMAPAPSRALGVLPTSPGGPFILILQNRNLTRLRHWNTAIRMFPIDLPVIESLIAEFQQGPHRLHQWLLDLVRRRPSTRHVRAVQLLIHNFQHEVNRLLESYHLILSSMGVLRPAYLNWLTHYCRLADGFDERHRVLQQSPIQSMLDFQPFSRAITEYLWEMQRIRSWFTDFHQPPPYFRSPHGRMLAVETALSELEYEQIRLEEEMWMGIEDPGEEDDGEPTVFIPTHAQTTDEQPAEDQPLTESAVDTESESSRSSINNQDAETQSLLSASTVSSEFEARSPEVVVHDTPDQSATEPATIGETEETAEDVQGSAALLEAELSEDQGGHQEGPIQGEVIFPGVPVDETGSQGQHPPSLHSSTIAGSRLNADSVEEDMPPSLGRSIVHRRLCHLVRHVLEVLRGRRRGQRRFDVNSGSRSSTPTNVGYGTLQNPIASRVGAGGIRDDSLSSTAPLLQHIQADTMVGGGQGPTMQKPPPFTRRLKERLYAHLDDRPTERGTWSFRPRYFGGRSVRDRIYHGW